MIMDQFSRRKQGVLVISSKNILFNFVTIVGFEPGPLDPAVQIPEQ